MKSAIINGMDVFTVYEKMKEIAEDVRENSEPWLVEIRTYRYRGHSMSDPMKYRTKEEQKEYEKLDPVERIKKYLIDEEIIDEERAEGIEDEVEQTVMDAIDFAEESDFPDEDALYEDMFVEDDYPFHT
jgi:pyruvate dehydrogenase E1 component alpha subunit